MLKPSPAWLYILPEYKRSGSGWIGENARDRSNRRVTEWLEQPILLVSKVVSFYKNFCKVNAIKKKKWHPVLHGDKLLDWLGVDEITIYNHNCLWHIQQVTSVLKSLRQVRLMGNPAKSVMLRVSGHPLGSWAGAQHWSECCVTQASKVGETFSVTGTDEVLL